MTDRILPFKKWHVMLLAVVVVAMLVLAGPAMRAEAAEPQAPPTPDGQWLGLLFDRVSLAAENQGNRIEYSKEIAAESQAWIDMLEAEGQDVSALQAALDEFNAEIAKAEESYNAAVEALNTHAGFDDQGNVTDASQGRETLYSAARDLRQAHLTLAQATLDFRIVIRDWRQEHETFQEGSETAWDVGGMRQALQTARSRVGEWRQARGG